MTDRAKRDLEGEFLQRWEFKGGHPLVRQYQFLPGRKFAFDFAHPATFVAIEMEGSTWAGGRHNTGKGYEADCEKYGMAASMGWVVFRLTSTMLTRDSNFWIGLIMETIDKLEMP